MDDLVAAIRAALPADVAFAGGSVAGGAGDLFAEEQAALGDVVPKRREQFRAGRTYARAALAALGFDPVPIAIAEDRAPVWPSGAVGSITHTDRYCGALAARAATYAGVGIDMEAPGPLEPDLVRMICSDAELRDRAHIESRLAADLPTLIFSAKESVYKAYAPAAQRFLDFGDLHVAVDPIRRTFVARLLGDAAAPHGMSEYAGAFLTHAHVVVTWTTVKRSDADAGDGARSAASARRDFPPR